MFEKIEKKHLYITAIMIIALSLFMNFLVSMVFHLSWQDEKWIVFRVAADFSFSFIFVLSFINTSKRCKEYDDMKLQKSCILVERIICSVTLIICLLESIRSEMSTPENIDFGMNIVVAGTVAQFGNLILRKQMSKIKKIVILISLLLVISIFMFGVFYKWIQLIRL